jgi:PAS domain-containing protein
MSLQNEPLELYQSWPLDTQAEQFRLGRILDIKDCVLPPAQSPDNNVLAIHGVGRWSCDLVDERLEWTDAVFDIFGLPRGSAVARAEAVSLYCEQSRAAMERLRAYAIRHRRGFTLDARIVPAQGKPRWMRLIAAPVCEGREVVRLEGLKIPIGEEA